MIDVVCCCRCSISDRLRRNVSPLSFPYTCSPAPSSESKIPLSDLPLVVSRDQETNWGAISLLGGTIDSTSRRRSTARPADSSGPTCPPRPSISWQRKQPALLL